MTDALIFGLGLVAGAALVTAVVLVLAAYDRLPARIDCLINLLEADTERETRDYDRGFNDGRSDGWQDAMESIHGDDEEAV